MALTVTEVGAARGIHGTVRETFYDVTFDNSYPTGGEALAAQNVGLDTIYGLTVVGQGLADGTPATTAYVVTWDQVNGKLQVFTAAGSGAIAAHTHDLRIIGGQAAAGTDTVQGSAADAILGKEEAANVLILGVDQATKGGVVPASAGSVAAAALAEAANGTDLSTLKIRVRVVGV